MLKCLENEPNLKNESNVWASHVSHKSLEIKYTHKTIINANEFGHGEEAHWIKGKTWMWSHNFIGRRNRKKEVRTTIPEFFLSPLLVFLFIGLLPHNVLPSSLMFLLVVICECVFPFYCSLCCLWWCFPFVGCVLSSTLILVMLLIMVMWYVFFFWWYLYFFIFVVFVGCCISWCCVMLLTSGYPWPSDTVKSPSFLKPYLFQVQGFLFDIDLVPWSLTWGCQWLGKCGLLVTATFVFQKKRKKKTLFSKKWCW